MADAEYLFVYGTLMRPLNHPMHRHLQRWCEYLENGYVHGSLYEIDRYPGLKVGDRERVYGEIYRILRSGTLFEILDRYEECDENSPRPHEYRRSLVEATGNSGTKFRCWAYLYQWNVSDDMKIAGGDYLRHIQRGTNEKRT